MQAASSMVENFTPWLNETVQVIKRTGNKEYFRKLVFEKKYTNWGTVSDESEHHNNILQSAITLYLSHVHGLKVCENAEYKLMAMGKEKYTGRSWNRKYGSTADDLAQYRIATSVPKNKWIEVQDGLFFRKIVDEEQNEEEEAQPKTTVDFEFKSSRPDGKKLINAFLADAFEWYRKEVEKQTDKARYMYVMQRAPGVGESNDDEDEGGSGSARKYKRYKLTDDKKFTSLFFPQKEKLMHLLKHFRCVLCFLV
jgi:hypothetical protein